MICTPRSGLLARAGAPMAAMAIAAMLTACAGEGPPAETATSAFDVMQRTIFDVHCATGGCHNSASFAGGLNLESGRSYAQLVGAPSVNAAAASAGLQRVVPLDPDRSFLLIKLTQPSAAQGSRMPLDGAPLSSNDINLIRSWISEGAPGSSLPSPTAEPSSTPTEPPTATESPLPSSTPTITATPTQTTTGTLPATATATVTASATATASVTATATIDPASTFTRLQQDIFSPTCATSFCHDALTQSGGLNLEADPYTALVNATPGNGIAAERGWLRVTPSNLDTSFLYFKLTLRQFDVELGSPMPLVGGPLPDADIAHVREWIVRGAPND